MLVHASRRSHGSWHQAPIQQEDGCERLKHLQPPLPCGQACQTSGCDANSLDFEVFLRCQGGSAAQMAA